MRVLAVADVYEALTAERPYRPAFSVDRALEIMRMEVPRRLDRDAFSALQVLLGAPIDEPAPRLQMTERVLGRQPGGSERR